MSRQDARSFVERVANDAEFRRLVSPAAETRDAERVIAVGAEHGLRFTASELDEAVNEQRFGHGTGELSDRQLEGVAGGWFGWWLVGFRRRGTTGIEGESDDSDHKGEIEVL